MRILPIAASIAFALTSTVALAATQTITVFDGAAVVPTPSPAHPKVVVDTDNRSHIVWSQSTDENASQYYNIFYKLIAADGSTLIDATQISSTTNSSHSYKPQIAVNGTDGVFVSWHGKGSDKVSLIGLNPSLDDLSGDAATLATIQRFSEKTEFTMTDAGSVNQTGHAYIDVDANGRAHILVQEKGDKMYCAVYNADGTVATALAEVISSQEQYGGHPGVALDENDKMHIAFVVNGANTKEIAYGMVDCAAGTTLIDTTIVSADDTVASMQPSMVYDAGTVYISWIDTVVGDNSSCSGGSTPNHDVANDCTEPDNELRFIALTPALDDLNGSAASLATITKIAEKSIPSLTAGEDEWYPSMGMTETGELQLLYYADASPENLFGTLLDTNGDVVAAATEIMNDATTARPTGKTLASVNNRATVYPEAQNIMLSLRDAAVPATLWRSDGERSGLFGLSLWSMLGLPALIGLLRLRRRS